MLARCLATLCCALPIAGASAQSLTWVLNPQNGHEYAVDRTARTWTAAAAFARANDAHLAVVRDAAENAFLASTFLTPSNSLWLGAQNVGGQWVWATGEPFAYSNWDVPNLQPDGTGPFLRMWESNVLGSPGTWDDTVDTAAQVGCILERSAEFVVGGAGCPGSNGTPSLSSASLPELGANVTLAIDDLPTGPGAAILFAGLAPATTPLDPLGMPGCVAHLQVFSDLLLPYTGTSRVTFASIPADAALHGVHVYLQAFVFDAPANAFGGTVSNLLDARLW